MDDQLRRLGLLLPIASAAVAFVVMYSLALLRARAAREHVSAATFVEILLVSFVVAITVLTLEPAQSPADRRLDLIPFRELQPRGYDHVSAAFEMTANMLLFAPLGFLLAARYAVRLRTILLLAIAFSLSLEAMQFVLRNGREASVTDIILNASGAAVGYAAWRVLRRPRTGPASSRRGVGPVGATPVSRR